MYTKINYCLLPGKAQEKGELALVERTWGILHFTVISEYYTVSAYRRLRQITTLVSNVDKVDIVDKILKTLMTD